ncbi:SusC/RagA family TonB-linked outer membrane protein [Alkalitalea saponilacus]|uniref:TonB-linked outer membrane protein, SusC/RagA family n=1 Tax=Alkalitalea saponilacus TaxID=889453 RepID=A0A1T5D8Q7_9BACT|nr:TonB-dependent receptor [Alkalitalea saponilacus]ASB50624.1 SusC/RagA family TonB-linked outer membrane protein [Alkalitalea saponilacus]SKB68084.1 TonB-linked outer membrane protein, SusC/RagA family [Alkalitalea saponilacus]
MKKTLGLLFLMMLATLVAAQDVTVTGRVTSESTGEPIPGVSVMVVGTTTGTITDIDGNFSLPTQMGERLRFSFIGMNNVEVAVTSSTHDVRMVETWTDLDEVVVVGYGVQRRSVITAAISSVSSDDLESSRPSRIEDVLKGRVSGVQITQSSGQPGSDSKLRIRGLGTINNSEPLYIVDGMAVDGGIDYLNPTDIESIEILKDAASAAVYGARAANGVVLVTTKSGSVARTTVNYDFSYGWQNPWRKKSVLDAREYMIIMNEALRNDGNAPRYSNEQIAGAGRGTDWQDETFNYDAPIQNHQVSIQGGSDQGTFFLSFGYFSQDGIVGGNYGKSNYERYSLRSNNNYTVFSTDDRGFLNKVRVGVNAGYSRILSSGIDPNSEYGSVLGSALAFNPIVPLYAEDPEGVIAARPTAVTDKDGRVFSLPPSGFQEIANPVAMLAAPQNSQGNSDKFVSTFWGELDVLEGLTFRSSYGVDLAFWGNDGYTFEHFLATQGKNFTQSHVFSNMHRGFRWQLENTLTYNFSVENHNFTALLGQSGQEYTYRNLGGDNYDLLENDPRKANINYGIADPALQRTWGGTGGFSAHTLASYFGRLDYNFRETYMFQATVRRDGSSNFGPNNKWGTFPSVSVGWNITNESFMDNRPDFLTHMRIRASWGLNGNERIPNFGYTSLMSGGQNYYFGSGDYMTMQYGASPSQLSNPDLKWEETEQINFGFETRMFNSALTFGFDYYKKTTTGMLMHIPIPAYVGKGSPWGNVGDMENSGFEFELGYRGRTGDFRYSISGNASYLENKLINLGNESGEIILESAGAAGLGAYVKGENGMPFPYFYGFKTDGILQNQAEADAYNAAYGRNARPGDVRFVDLNGDGQINDADRTKIGKGMPDWTFGFNLNAEWRNFDLNMFFQGTYGNDIFDYSVRGDIPAMNRPSWILDRWTGEGTSDRIPRMTNANPNGNWASSDLYVKDGSYLRLKTMQIGYTLPTEISRRVSIDRFRIYVSGDNLLTFTGYDGFEPEIASGGFTTIGIDRGIYPQARTISVGANITF